MHVGSKDRLQLDYDVQSVKKIPPLIPIQIIVEK